MRLIKRYNSFGFTLIELMITIAIVAVLASIAIPSYNNALAKSDRTTAISDVGDISLALERYYATNRVYTDDFGDLNMAGAGVQSLSDSKSHYNYNITMPANQVYTITATPIESRDPWTLVQNHLGVQTSCKDCALTDALPGWP